MPPARRGRAAPPVETVDLPPLALRAAIAEAVHQAVVAVIAESRVHWRDGSGACSWYAATASRVAAAVMGRDYRINAGTFRLQTSTREGGLGFEMNAADPLIVGQEFHAVAISRPGAGAEFIDLASRHWKTWALRLGAPWDAPEPPPFVWCLQRELPQQWPLGIAYVAHVPSTERLISLLRGEGAPVLARMVNLATAHLAESEAAQDWARSRHL